MGQPAPVGGEPYRDLLSRPMVLKAESVGFVLLNLLDLIISRASFQWEGLWAGYEVNPVVACQVIWHKYPRIARGILIGGCLVFCYVVIRSTWQLYRHTGVLPWW